MYTYIHIYTYTAILVKYQRHWFFQVLYQSISYTRVMLIKHVRPYKHIHVYVALHT